MCEFVYFYIVSLATCFYQTLLESVVNASKAFWACGVAKQNQVTYYQFPLGSCLCTQQQTARQLTSFSKEFKSSANSHHNHKMYLKILLTCTRGAINILHIQSSQPHMSLGFCFSLVILACPLHLMCCIVFQLLVIKNLETAYQNS